MTEKVKSSISTINPLNVEDLTRSLMQFRKEERLAKPDPEAAPTPLPLISTQNYFGLQDLFDPKNLSDEFLKTSDYDPIGQTDLDYDVDQGLDEDNGDQEDSQLVGENEGFNHWLDVPKEGVSNWTESTTTGKPHTNAEPRKIGFFDQTFPPKRRRQLLKVKRIKQIASVEAVPTVSRPEPGFLHPEIYIKPKTLRHDVRPARVRLFYERVDQDDDEVGHPNRARQTPKPQIQKEENRFEAPTVLPNIEPQNFGSQNLAETNFDIFYPSRNFATSARHPDRGSFEPEEELRTPDVNLSRQEISSSRPPKEPPRSEIETTRTAAVSTRPELELRKPDVVSFRPDTTNARPEIADIDYGQPSTANHFEVKDSTTTHDEINLPQFPSFKTSFNHEFGDKITTKFDQKSYQNVKSASGSTYVEPDYDDDLNKPDVSSSLPFLPSPKYPDPEIDTKPPTTQIETEPPKQFDQYEVVVGAPVKTEKSEIEKLEQLLVVDPYADVTDDDLGPVVNYEPQVIAVPIDHKPENFPRYQNLLNLDTFGIGNYQDSNNLKRETAGLNNFNSNYNNNLNNNYNSKVVYSSSTPNNHFSTGPTAAYIQPPASTAIQPTKATYVENFSFRDPVSPVKPLGPVAPVNPTSPSQPVSYEIGSKDSFFDNGSQEAGLNNEPGPPYHIQPPEHAIFALPPAEHEPIFRGELDRFEQSTVQSTRVPSRPLPGAIPEHYGPALDLYSKDIYSEQSFAQLEPFFYPSEPDPRPEFDIAKAPTFPGIIRHISTYSRSLDLNGVQVPRRFDVTDFGAATGQDGAFGWYSDHPVTKK